MRKVKCSMPIGFLGCFAVAGCGCTVQSSTATPSPSIFANRTDYSSQWYGRHGLAYSPDNQYYAEEVEPYNSGNIGIFSRSDDQLILQFEALPEGIYNDLKAIAWSPNSKYLAIMYHGTILRSGIYLYAVRTGELIRYIGPGGDNQVGYYHPMVFSDDGTLIYVSSTGKKIDNQFNADPIVFFREYSGVNLPWINYGWDIGRNPWGGSHGGFSGNEARLQSDFEFLAQHEVKIVRVFTFCDLRSGVLFDQNGIPTDFDQYALEDFETLVQAAEASNLHLIIVLLDHKVADGVAMEGSTPVGEHPDLIFDLQKRAALLELFSSLLQTYKDNETIFAWEVMNEPEYATAVSESQFGSFYYDFYHMKLETAPQAQLTVGHRNRGDLPDVPSRPYYGLLQFHYYDKMEKEFPLDFPVSKLYDWDVLLIQPVLIGEAETTNVAEKMETVHLNGYMGILFWSLNAEGDFCQVADEYQNWISTN